MSDPSTLPARPPSEVEWEDALLRLELMVRALRAVADEADAGVLHAHLGTMLEREGSVAAWLEARAGVERTGSGQAALESMRDEPARLIDRFISLRSRNFAMVQRRGLEVWDWSGAYGAHEVTAFQLLSWLTTRDVSALEGVRRGVTPAC